MGTKLYIRKEEDDVEQEKLHSLYHCLLGLPRGCAGVLVGTSFVS